MSLSYATHLSITLWSINQILDLNKEVWSKSLVIVQVENMIEVEYMNKVIKEVNLGRLTLVSNNQLDERILELNIKQWKFIYTVQTLVFDTISKYICIDSTVSR